MNERSLFLAAVEIDDSEKRAAYLRDACGEDAELRRGVEELLQANAAAGSFMDTPAATMETAHSDASSASPLSLDFLTPSDLPGSLGKLGSYEITSVIGTGGMGIVLEGRDTRLDRIVAVKVLAPQLATTADARQRFLREAKAAAAVRDEHVVTIYAVEEANGLPYLVMELIAGMSLQERIDKGGPLQLKEILRIGAQTARGLAAAHGQGLVHRDIKPANILLENGVERVKLTDFGLARVVDESSLTQAGVIAGTPQYMAPEQAKGEAVDHRSDLFSLGSVLYAICTGQSPFRGSTTLGVIKRVCEEQPRPIRELNPEIPDWLCEIIARLHAKDPAERYQAAAEVADLLSQHLAQLQQSTQPKVIERSLPKSEVRNPKSAIAKRPWALAATAAAILLLIGISVTEATGVTHFAPTVLRIVTGKGTLLVEVNDPAVKVTVEGGGGLVITGAGLHEVHLNPGQYQVRADKDGQRVPLNQDLVTITRGGEELVKVRLEPEFQPQQPDADWVPLFNGKDLTGWKTHPNQPGKWRVEDGILVGDAPGDNHLFSHRGSFQDFHLRAEVKINQTGKGAIFFRSEFGFNNPSGKFPLGLEASIYNGPQGTGTREHETETTGSLYWINGFSGVLVPQEDWFTLEVIARGRHIVIKVNGRTTTDKRLSSDEHNHAGPLALMQRSNTVIQFRKIEVKDLSRGPFVK